MIILREEHHFKTFVSIHVDGILLLISKCNGPGRT